MNKFKIYLVVISLGFTLFSCGPEDVPIVPLRDYAEQYNTDIAMIEDYLQTYYIEKIVDHPGYTDDQDVILSKIPTGNTTLVPIWDSPMLFSKEVELHGITYKVYYLKFRPDHVDGVAPTRMDQVLSSYDGKYLKYTTTTVNNIASTSLDQISFEKVIYPQSYFGLDGTIRGWSEIFPLFKSGTYEDTPGPDPAIFEDFGAGVMFLPSGLGYYAAGSFQIPAYSPLVFSFKLYSVKRSDQDGDGILSIYEDINGDGIFDDDSDGDGTYDIYDKDDDGDGTLTKDEIKDADGKTYAYDAIPDCSGNTSDPTRTKRYLDKNCFKD